MLKVISLCNSGEKPNFVAIFVIIQYADLEAEFSTPTTFLSDRTHKIISRWCCVPITANK